MSEAPRIRECPEDFIVEELPLYPCSGEGEHTFVWVEKRLRTTEQVARMLAREAGVRPRDVGYAGRKDRNAVDAAKSLAASVLHELGQRRTVGSFKLVQSMTGRLCRRPAKPCLTSANICAPKMMACASFCCTSRAAAPLFTLI